MSTKKRIVVSVSLSLDEIVEAILNAHDENTVFKVIKQLDDSLENADFTQRLYRHFKGLNDLIEGG